MDSQITRRAFIYQGTAAIGLLGARLRTGNQALQQSSAQLTQQVSGLTYGSGAYGSDVYSGSTTPTQVALTHTEAISSQSYTVTWLALIGAGLVSLRFLLRRSPGETQDIQL